MSMTYEEFAQLPASEKIILCIVHSKAMYKIWNYTGESGIYYRDVEFFISKVKADGIDLIENSNTSLIAGQYFFDATSKRLYVRLPDDVEPKTKQVIVTNKHFFSNAPVILPHDLDSGEPVEYEARIPTNGIGSLGQQLDSDNTGIVLESSSSIILMNSDAFFDEIFDTLIWENQDIEFYSWSPIIPLSQKKRLFSGVIETKNYDDEKATFNVKDYVYRLKNNVNLGTFSINDGHLSDSDLNTPKRRIYGKVKQAKCVGIDKMLSGYGLTGLITVSAGSAALSGSGTSFLQELSPGDQLVIELDNGETQKLSIDSISSDDSATLGDESDVSISNLTAVVKSDVPYPFKNRRWHLAGHKLASPAATIMAVDNSRRFQVDQTEDFFADDAISVNGAPNILKRISGSNMVLETAMFPVPVIGDQILKEPVTKVFFKDQEMLQGRDWTLENTNEAIIVFNELAEFNIAKIRKISNNLVFTNGSRSITTSATVDLRTLLKPRDWIKKNDISAPEWYEILEVKEQSLTLRTTFTGSSGTTTAKIKNIDHIDDDSLITANALGFDFNGQWMRTPSDMVKHLLLNDSEFSSVDEASFSQAKSDCPYTVSMIIPEDIGGEAPKVRDVITKINESVFGSLYGNSSSDISYSILNARKPSDLNPIRDHDIIDWDAKTEQQIVNKVKINFRPFVDTLNGSSAFESVEFTSNFVDDFIGIKNTFERTVYLYDEEKANIMAQRHAFYRSLSNCKINLKGKLNLATLTVNDKLYLELDRLFKRYGGKDSRKISIVTGIKKNGMDVDVEMTDLGNIFNRVPSIAPEGLPSYLDANREDSLKYGFILDNDTLTPDVLNETDLGNNRIG